MALVLFPISVIFIFLAYKLSRNGKGLPHYINLRKVSVLKLFSTKSLETYRHIRADEVRVMVKFIFKDCTSPYDHGRGLVVRKKVGAVAFNNITRLLFGKRFENEDGVLNQQGMEFVAHLVKKAERDKYDLNQDNIGGLLWGMVFAGMDAVAISVEWAMAELIKNPRRNRRHKRSLTV
ncbi:hypothetical protein M0R45_023249 [Rubus argutus]|uniref:Uncharacterized protein n=1 Tax=Rubus argutus TaxID=59490 RepID=A0AAW1WQU8_RUBAR